MTGGDREDEEKEDPFHNDKDDTQLEITKRSDITEEIISILHQQSSKDERRRPSEDDDLKTIKSIPRRTLRERRNVTTSTIYGEEDLHIASSFIINILPPVVPRVYRSM